MVNTCLARRNLSVPDPIMSAIQLIRHAESEGNAGLPTHFIKALGLRQEQRQTPVDERLMAVFGRRDGVIHCQIRGEKTSKFAK